MGAGRAQRSAVFPLGDAYFPLGRTAFPEDGADTAWAVGSRPELASPFGVHDLIGEFGEYTCDAFMPHSGTNEALFEQHFPKWRSERAVRGGYDVYQDSTCVYRGGIGEDVRSRGMKLRCVGVDLALPRRRNRSPNNVKNHCSRGLVRRTDRRSSRGCVARRARARGRRG